MKPSEANSPAAPVRLDVPPFADEGYGKRLIDEGEAYIAEYEYDDYTPSEFERGMISDAFNGIMSYEPFFGIIRSIVAPVAEPMRVIDPDEWEPCSPEYLNAGGKCSAPRVWNAAECNHYHPKLRAASPAPVDAGVREALIDALAGLKYIEPAIPVLRTMFMTADLALGARKAEEMDASNKEAIKKLEAVLAALSSQPVVGVDQK